MNKKAFEEIKKAKSVLLHLHPSPDPDSAGSALAMKFALEGLSKRVVVIQGDTDIGDNFNFLPGVQDIVRKDFSQIDLKDFDLFIILDAGSPEMISGKKTPVFPLPIKTIVIDHHSSNNSYGDINIVDTKLPSTTSILFNLFKEWHIGITKEIALNLFIGLYTDTGGFKYQMTSSETFSIASELVKIVPEYHRTIFEMENGREKEDIYFEALALDSIKVFLDGNLAISSVSFDQLKEKGISVKNVITHNISNDLKSVKGWNIGVAMAEIEPNNVKISLRTRDSEVFDVSRLAIALGGGGHKAASGAYLRMPLEEAIKKVVDTAKSIYKL